MGNHLTDPSAAQSDSHVSHQQFFYKVFYLKLQILWESYQTSQDLLKDSSVVLALEGQRSHGQLVQQDAHSPPIYTFAVALSQEDLRSHVVRRATERVSASGRLLGHAKVNELDKSVGLDHNVLRLKVSVNNVFGVDVLQTQNHLRYYVSAEMQGQLPVVLQKVVHLYPRQVLEYQVKQSRVLGNALQLHQEREPQLTQYPDFRESVGNQSDSHYLRLFYGLDCVLPASELASAHDGKGPRSDTSSQVQFSAVEQFYINLHQMGNQHNKLTKHLPMVGFQNKKNNLCYLNSVLQGLINCQLFSKSLMQEQRLMDSSLVQALQSIVRRKVQAQEFVVVSSQRLVEQIRKASKSFQEHQHHDAHEVLIFLLDHIAQKIKSCSKQKNWIHELYLNVVNSKVECCACGTVISRDESSLCVSLPPLRNKSLNFCLKEFLKEEKMQDKDQYFCQNCNGMQNASIKSSFKRLSPVLILHLKRFTYSSREEKVVKLDYNCAFPIRLHLADQTANHVYDLYAIVVHLGGGFKTGHYITLVRVEHDWVILNDDWLQSTDSSGLFRLYGGRREISAYMLFYKSIR